MGKGILASGHSLKKGQGVEKHGNDTLWGMVKSCYRKEAI